jgi:hypothetical protein
MLFFKRILDVKKSDTAPSERRGNERYAVLPDFPVKTVINIISRDDFGQPIKTRNGEGTDWTGRLINLSSAGARVQLPRTISALRGDPCLLKIDVQGFELSVPGKVAHVAERRDSFVFGLALNLEASPAQLAFRQLVELVALGATLKQVRPPQPDASGYVVEQYAGDPASRLTIWRHLVGREVAAFEFQLKDCAVRGVAGRDGIECFASVDTAHSAPVKGAREDEIQRLYQWVVLNLAAAVPADVREFLQRHAA